MRRWRCGGCCAAWEAGLHALAFIALFLQAAAAAWSFSLIRRSRDWRFGMFVALLWLLVVRRALLIVWSGGASPEVITGSLLIAEVLLGTIIAACSLAVVWFLGSALQRRDESERDLRLLAGTLSDSSVAVLITDAGRDGNEPRITFVNGAMERMTGYTPQELLGNSPDMLLAPDAESTAVSRLKSDASSTRGFITEIRARRRDGSDYWVTWSVSPVRSETGVITHFMLVQHDVTERRTAQAALSQALEKLSFHVNNSPLGVVEWDDQFRVMFWSAGAERIFGWKAAEVVGKRPDEWDIVHHEDRESVAQIVARLSDGRDDRNFSSNRNVTRSGEVIDCEWYNSALRTPEGRLVSILSLVRDVSDRRRAEDHQRLMMRELDHRVKNNLAQVAGIAERTLDASASLQEFRRAFMGRIEAMSRAHGVLARSNWTGVSVDSLVSQVLAAYTDRLDASGPHVTLSAAEGTILALVLHELAVNAAKHGALSIASGRVSARWRIDSTEESLLLRIEWAESGGPSVQVPVHKGFGTQFIREALSYELKGAAEFVYETSGLVCRLNVPLPARRRHEPSAA